jgi:phenylpropionate dioxygenase-like ring-hydroxylating dioxygenase large terminal subunit
MNIMLKPSSGRGQTFESLSASLRDAIQRIPPHEKNIPPAIEATKPATDFTDPAVWEREKARIFRRFPVVMAPSARMPERGSAMAHDGYGVPVVLTRDGHGKVRAFLNACTHKAAELTTDCSAHHASTLSCPFHAWTYSLDGRLIGVPRQETLANFSKESRPLAQLPCAEVGGLIWAILDPRAPADFSAVHEQLAIDFESLGLPTAFAYGYRRFSLKANWKGVMEPFLEGYHVQRLHSKSIGPQGANMFADVVGVTDRFGRNLRQTSGRINFSPDMLAERDINIRNYIVHAYNLFPSTVVITSPYYTSVMSFMPLGADRTEVDYHMLVEGPPDNAKAEDLYARSFAVIQDVFGNEDFAGSETCQVGLNAGAIKDVIYTGMEVNIPRFYEGVDSALAD